jgi:hypothetical protein
LGTLHEREAAVIARCSRYAAQYVEQLRDHALYAEVLSRLEAIHGQLFELDVESAFYEALRAHYNINPPDAAPRN